jgi:hypothetical protein
LLDAFTRTAQAEVRNCVHKTWDAKNCQVRKMVPQHGLEP